MAMMKVFGREAVIGAMHLVVKGVEGPAAMTALRSAADIVVNDAKRRSPWKTGNLRRSIHQEDGEGLSVSVGTDVEYAPYQEFGTSRMAAHPFLRPALDENEDEIRREIADTIRDLLP